MTHRLLTPAHVRAVIWDRQGGMCARCWTGMEPDTMDAHHRLRRRDLGWCSCNVVGLHPTCHTIAPGAVHQAVETATAAGLIVRSGIVSPADVPLWAGWPWQAWSMLTCDGLVEQAPEGAELPDGTVMT